MNEAFIRARISYYETLIANIEAQILALSVSSTQSYTLNTGQSSQSVTKKKESELNSLLQSAIEQLESWTARIDGGGVSYLRPFQGNSGIL